MNKFKALREEHHLTQRELAKKIYVAQQTINNYENGKRFPSKGVLGKMADFFGVSIDYLMDTSEIKTPADKMMPTALDGVEQDLIALLRTYPEEIKIDFIKLFKKIAEYHNSNSAK